VNIHFLPKNKFFIGILYRYRIQWTAPKKRKTTFTRSKLFEYSRYFLSKVAFCFHIQLDRLIPRNKLPSIATILLAEVIQEAGWVYMENRNDYMAADLSGALWGTRPHLSD
jgi:hypothetical protein